MNKILLAYDGGDASRHALETAVDLALAFRASLSVVSVVPVGPDGVPTAPWDGGEAHARDLHQATSRLAEKGIAVDLLEPLGDPIDTIERIAVEGGFDTIVIGSRGVGALDRVLRGGISEHPMPHPSLTVVVTP